MPAALPLTDRISQSSQRKTTPRSISCQFGDGYEQIRPDGINYLVDEWSIQYEALNATERATLVNVLRSVGAWDYLTWTPIGSSTPLKWRVVGGWTESPQSGALYSLSFNLKQFF
ncbi:hypothetical protein DBA29_20390 [Xenophilus aerolatus]|nr:hypothetical protein [Xenophilus aerolatus]